MRSVCAWCTAALVASVAGAGFEPLFDGVGLDGWTQRAGDPARRGTFHVEEGVIVGTYVAGTANTFLVTDERFGDFVLEFDFFVSPGVNSGVQFRSELAGDRVAGYQFEIDPSPRAWTGGVYHEAGRGWLYPLELNPDAKRPFRVAEWNTARIECVGRSIRTWLNDTPVAHLVDDQLDRGFVALQVHGLPAGATTAGRTVRWRNIRIDRAPSAEPTPPDPACFVRNLVPNDLDRAEAMLGWRRLFDGRDLSAWRGVLRDDFPTQGWRIDTGVLVVEGEGGGDIVTRETFSAFELQLDVRLTAGANSGIKYVVREDAGRGTAFGLEYQILDDDRHPDGTRGVAGNRTLASLYDLIPSDRRVNGREVPRRVGGWNHVRIVCRPDGIVQHWLNDYEVVTYTRGDDAFRALVARSKYKDLDGFGLDDAGHLLLQDHGDEVHFRSIKVRRIESSPVERRPSLGDTEDG